MFDFVAKIAYVGENYLRLELKDPESYKIFNLDCSPDLYLVCQSLKPIDKLKKPCNPSDHYLDFLSVKDELIDKNLLIRVDILNGLSDYDWDKIEPSGLFRLAENSGIDLYTWDESIENLCLINIPGYGCKNKNCKTNMFLRFIDDTLSVRKYFKSIDVSDACKPIKEYNQFVV